MILITGSILFGPIFLLPSRFSTFILMSFGWLLAPVLVISLTVLLISLVEEVWTAIRRRMYPAIDELDISPRITSLLRRHDLVLIEQVDRAPDAMMLLIPNLDHQGLAEIRRAISLWKYRQWQDAGFPEGGP